MVEEYAVVVRYYAWFLELLGVGYDEKCFGESKELKKKEEN